MRLMVLDTYYFIISTSVIYSELINSTCTEYGIYKRMILPLWDSYIGELL